MRGFVALIDDLGDIAPCFSLFEESDEHAQRVRRERGGFASDVKPFERLFVVAHLDGGPCIFCSDFGAIGESDLKFCAVVVCLDELRKASFAQG